MKFTGTQERDRNGLGRIGRVYAGGNTSLAQTLPNKVKAIYQTNDFFWLWNGDRTMAKCRIMLYPKVKSSLSLLLII